MRRIISNCRNLWSVAYTSKLRFTKHTVEGHCERSYLLDRFSNENYAGLGKRSFVAHKLLLNYAVGAGSSRDFSSCTLWSSTLAMAFGSALLVGANGFSEPTASEAGRDDHNVNGTNDGGITSFEDVINPEKVMEQVKIGIEERLKSLNLSSSTLSPFTIAAKGQQVAIKIPVSPLCDLWRLVVDVVSRVGRLTSGLGDGKMLVSALESAVALVLMIEHAEQLHERRLESDHQGDSMRQSDLPSNSLCMWVFEPLIGDKFPEVEFLKKGYFSAEELDLVVSTLRLASSETSRETPRQSYKRAHERKNQAGSKKNVLETLEAMGVKIYGQESMPTRSDREVVSWDNIAGYHEQKREIEDTVLLALRCPEIYDSIARGTRRKFESNRPRAVLFEGPPGTGKTSSARVIASQAGVPLLYVPLEVVMSKYYGESERTLGKVFDTANELPNGAIIFLDEIDSLAMTRDSEMHEATRRMLSVLLRQIDGFEQDTRVVVIAATNRKEDLDPAIISRFDCSIAFDLPDQQTREEIAAQYARHLTSAELAALAAVSEGMAGRDLRDICQQAERHWASKLIRDHAGSPMTYGLPPIQEYIDCAEKRRLSIHTLPHEKDRQMKSSYERKGRPLWPPSVVV